jgi:transcriptional regulator with PAS, ATPase and Fis domain
MSSLAEAPATRASAAQKLPPFVTASEPMKELLALTEKVALTDAKVLITGESGVGKDLIARRIHAFSARAEGPFVAVNCAGLTETLLESELFGHVKGSFTGAYRDKPGKLQMANRGTLFLDEVGEMSLRMQSLLLRFLENGEIQAVGSEALRTRVDVRVVAATNRNLGEMVATGHFREDLLYRLNVVHLQVPPLRERREDIRMLVQYFLDRTHRGAQPITFTEEALLTLDRYRWPGNVRELQNVVEQACFLGHEGVVDASRLPPAIRTAADSVLPARERRRQVADELYEALVSGGYSFWEHIYPLFVAHDITRHDVRELVRRGLSATRGSYRVLLRLFRMQQTEYKRFLNFLTAHQCRVDFREFRNCKPAPTTRRPKPLLPPLDGRDGSAGENADPDEPVLAGTPAE